MGNKCKLPKLDSETESGKAKKRPTYQSEALGAAVSVLWLHANLFRSDAPKVEHHASVPQLPFAMDSSHPPSAGASRDVTPNPTVSSRFTSQNATAEDLLKAQTVGLVNLSDFRKRRAEALEVKEREGLGHSSGRATPVSGASTPADR